jgi:hypothetical protein
VFDNCDTEMKFSISALGKRECPRSARLLSVRRVFAVSGPSIEVCNRLNCNVNFTYLTATRQSKR